MSYFEMKSPPHCQVHLRAGERVSHHALVGSVEAPEVLLAAGCMWEETFGSALECWGKELDASGEQHKTNKAHLGRCWEWLVGPVSSTLVLEVRDLRRSVQAVASVVEVVGGPPPEP